MGKTIRTKLLISYLIFVLIITFIDVLSIFLVSKVNNNGKEMYNNRVVPLTSLVSIAEKAGNVRLQMVQALLRKDSSMTEQAVMNLKEIDSIINKYEKHNLGKEERKVFESFSADWHILAKGYRKIWR